MENIMHSWQLQEAKKRLSEVVKKAVHEGPQMVTQSGKEIAVLISVAEYKKLVKPVTSIVKFFRNSPLVGLGIDFERDCDIGRDTDF